MLILQLRAVRFAQTCQHTQACLLPSLPLGPHHCILSADSGLAEAARLPFLRSLHLSFCVRITDSGLAQLAAPQGSSRVAGSSLTAQRCSGQVVQAESGRGRAALHRGSASLDWHCAPQPAAQAAHRTGSCDVQQLPRPWDAEEQRLPAPPSAAAAAAGDGGWQEAGGSSRGGENLLQELELYHVPQVCAAVLYRTCDEVYCWHCHPRLQRLHGRYLRSNHSNHSLPCLPHLPHHASSHAVSEDVLQGKGCLGRVILSSLSPRIDEFDF
jgi:hypothetical protein